MKKFSLILLSLIFGCASNNLTVSGAVLDQSGAGIDNIEVVIESQNSTSKVATNDSGEYKTKVPMGFSGAIYPLIVSAIGQVIPSIRNYTNLQTNQTSQDFVATVASFTLSGKICLSNGTALSGVTVTASGTDGNGNSVSVQALTNSTGAYTLNVPFGFTGTTTPSKAGHTFQVGNACP